ncbi:hypothetical protein [Microvirga sp. BSC39]|uniref:hypothetical protein n=1 Tax=Microvirga sp. BSC39 TaxID=1549810 RepID=UPI0004E9294A|nr:hypothetical protein [Microvirga sp. BSC39]KFG68481.1 hypothetical protein JH26_16720 [Microvirga sp. BSC39]
MMKSATESLPDAALSPGRAPTRRSRFLLEAGDQSFAFASQIVLNGSFFLIMLTASMRFEPSEFLKLTFANSLIPLIAAALDFGLSQSCLALSFEHKKQDYVTLNLVIKGAIVTVAISCFAASLLVFGLVPELVLVLAAASLSFWTATRVVEQYAKRFRQYAKLNVALAVSRIVLGFIAITYDSSVTLIIAVYILAQVPIQIATLRKNADLRLKSVDLHALRAMVRMAPMTFLSLNLYSSLPLMTLWILKIKDDTVSAAAFGVVLIFLAPVDLLYGTLKVYIFPKMIEANFSSIDLFGMGNRSMYLLMGGVCALLALSIVPGSILIDFMYNTRFPEADVFFMTYFSCHASASVIGLYTLHSQRPGLIHLSLVTNALRAGGTALFFLVPGMSSYSIVLGSGIIIVLGEFLLAMMLRRAARHMHL